MRIEPASPTPIFQQIADGIRAAVAAGVYRPGDLIPSVRAQALNLVVNPNTVQRAYEQLEREGLIESRKGTGMVVAVDATVAARNGSGDAVRSTFAQGISLGQSAGMSRAAIDRTYREAWDASNPAPSNSTRRSNP
jgi:GntR family transcriptional regulator